MKRQAQRRPAPYIRQILLTFQTTDLPVLNKLKNYFDGKQDIIYKEPVDDGRPDNKIIINYCKMIVDNYSVYLLGKQLSFMGDNIDEIQEILDYNDIHQQMTEYLRQALIFGRGFLINYVDTEGKQRIQVLDSRNCIPVYDDTIEHNLLYVIRMWEDTSRGQLSTDIRYKVEVYGPSDIKYYNSTAGFETFELERVEPHYYGQCPITVFSLNHDEVGIFQPVLSIQDAVNTLVSGEIDNYEDFADAYLVLQGMTADENDLKNMKQHRCILLDGEEHCSAQFLTKTISDTQVENILTNLNTQLYSIAQCPDFSDPQSFGNANSGVALRYKLLSFENACAGIEAYMRKAIQRIIELVVELLNLTDAEETWRDIQIIFRRNLPVDMAEVINVVNGLRGIVSTETLLSQIPFIDSPEEEIEKLNKENDILDLYNFNHTDEEVKEDDNE